MWERAKESHLKFSWRYGFRMKSCQAAKLKQIPDTRKSLSRRALAEQVVALKDPGALGGLLADTEPRPDVPARGERRPRKVPPPRLLTMARHTGQHRGEFAAHEAVREAPAVFGWGWDVPS